jgi:hypothetical protein
MKKIIKYYPEAWFKVEYEVEEITVKFKAWKIQSLDEDNPKKSDIGNDEPNIEGYIKWDGCLNFKQDDHYCGMYHAKQTLLLMTEIYRFKSSLGGSFEDEEL